MNTHVSDIQNTADTGTPPASAQDTLNQIISSPNASLVFSVKDNAGNSASIVFEPPEQGVSRQTSISDFTPVDAHVICNTPQGEVKLPLEPNDAVGIYNSMMALAEKGALPGNPYPVQEQLSSLASIVSADPALKASISDLVAKNGGIVLDLAEGPVTAEQAAEVRAPQGTAFEIATKKSCETLPPR